MTTRYRRIALKLLIGVVAIFGGATSPGCSKMTPSIEKISNTERADRVARTDAERDAKAKEAAAERARAVEADRAAAAKENAVVMVVPLEIRVHGRSDLIKSRKVWAATDLDGAAEIVELGDSDRDSLVGPDAMAKVELERKLPATYSAILHVFVEKESAVKPIVAADVRGTFEAVTKTAETDPAKKIAYALRLKGAEPIDSATLEAIANAAMVFEIR